MIQLTRSGVVISNLAQYLEGIRVEFEQRHCVLLPGLLEAGLLKFVQREIESANFKQRTHGNIGVEFVMESNKALSLLYFLANNSRLLQVIQQVTGSAKIGSFAGRVYRVVPGCGHYDRWHDDLTGDRMVALSVNLSTEIYSGGVLQIRERRSKRIEQEIANVGFGDGVVFKLDKSLEHRITDIEGEIPKTAFAGWFQSRPDFVTLLAEHSTLAAGSRTTPGVGRNHAE